MRNKDYRSKLNVLASVLYKNRTRTAMNVFDISLYSSCLVSIALNFSQPWQRQLVSLEFKKQPASNISIFMCISPRVRKREMNQKRIAEV